MREHRRITGHGAPASAARVGRPGRAGPTARAFTLIEMLVVLLIIAIVLSLGAGVATSIISRTDREETKARLKIVWEAMSEFHDDTGGWPGQLTDLAGNEKAAAVLRRLPVDAFNGNEVRDRYGQPLHYSSTGGFGGGPALYSVGPDGQHDASNRTDAKNNDNIYHSEN